MWITVVKQAASKQVSKHDLRPFNSHHCIHKTNTSLITTAHLPVLSELHRMVSFSRPPGPCLIHTEMVKGSFRLVLTTPSGTFTAWVPLNSKTWSLSWPLSVGRPAVQLVALLGEGSSSTVPELAPEFNQNKEITHRAQYLTEINWTAQIAFAL